VKIPGVLYTAVVAALYALLDSLATGVSALDALWVPTAITLLGMAAKWLDMQKPAGGERSLDGDGSAARRFWLG